MEHGMSDYPMTDAIAEREYELLRNDATIRLRVSVGKPTQVTDSVHPAWYCPWTIRDGSGVRNGWAKGEDSLQALLLGLSALRTELAIRAREGPLAHFGVEGSGIALVE
jgi:hypothetical protein